jgi:hypothetical protein
MIRSCRDKDAQRRLERKFSRRLQAIEKSGRIRLEVLDAATSLRDLDLPGFRLEALKGDRRGNTAFGSTTNTGFASGGKTGMPTAWRLSTIARRCCDGHSEIKTV